MDKVKDKVKTLMQPIIIFLDVTTQKAHAHNRVGCEYLHKSCRNLRNQSFGTTSPPFFQGILGCLKHVWLNTPMLEPAPV